MIVRFTAAAESDLESIGDHIAADDPRRALAFVGEIRVACEGLADAPERYPFVARYERHGIRRRLVGNYLIFYRVENKVVLILHILHGARDYAALLFPD